MMVFVYHTNSNSLEFSEDVLADLAATIVWVLERFVHVEFLLVAT